MREGSSDGQRQLMITNWSLEKQKETPYIDLSKKTIENEPVQETTWPQIPEVFEN